MAAGHEGLSVDGLLDDRRSRSHDQRGPSVGVRERGEGLQTLLGRIDVRHEPLEGEGLGLWEVEPCRIGVAPDSELLVDAACVLRTGSNNQSWDTEGTGQGSEGEGNGIGQHLDLGVGAPSTHLRHQHLEPGLRLQQAPQRTKAHGFTSKLKRRKGQPAGHAICAG